MGKSKKIIIGIIVVCLLGIGVSGIFLGKNLGFWTNHKDVVEILEHYEEDLDTFIQSTGCNFELNKKIKNNEMYVCKENKMYIVEEDDNRMVVMKYEKENEELPVSICNIRKGMTREEVGNSVLQMEGYAFQMPSKLQKEIEGEEDLGDYFFDLDKEYVVSVQYKNNQVFQVALQRMDEMWKSYFK